MSDGDSRGKPYAPSEHRLREARERGEVPQIKDLPAAASVMLVCVVIGAVGETAAERGRQLLNDLIVIAFAADTGARQCALAARLTAGFALEFIAPMLLLAGLSSTALRRLLIGPVASMKPLMPDFKRINPVSGFTRLISRDTWFALAKSLLTLTIVMTTLGNWIVAHLRGLLGVHGSLLAWRAGNHFLWVEALIASAMLCAVALIDTLWQRDNYFGRMRMDMKDLRDEHKNLQGNPEIQHERKREHQRLLNS